jgi:hypothetical protein
MRKKCKLVIVIIVSFALTGRLSVPGSVSCQLRTENNMMSVLKVEAKRSSCTELHIPQW